MIGDVVILERNEPEVALKLFEDRTNSRIDNCRKGIEEFQRDLKAIEKWRSEHESNP